MPWMLAAAAIPFAAGVGCATAGFGFDIVSCRFDSCGADAAAGTAGDGVCAAAGAACPVGFAIAAVAKGPLGGSGAEESALGAAAGAAKAGLDSMGPDCAAGETLTIAALVRVGLIAAGAGPAAETIELMVVP